MRSVSPQPLVVLALYGLAIFAVGAHVLLLAGLRVPSWGLPVALLLPFALLRCERPPRLPLSLWALLALCAIPGIAGTLATEDRAWDGLASWTLRARFLATTEGIAHPFFRDPTVCNYSRTYQLLQPSILASLMPWVGTRGARLVVTACYLAFVALLGTALRGRGVQPRFVTLTMVGAALTPILLGPGHGAIDSGFADPLQCMLLTAAAAALTLDHRGLAASAALLLPLGKTEGLIEVVVFLAVALLTRRDRAAIGAAVGGAIGLGIWLPLLVQLADAAAPTSVRVLAATAGGAAMLLPTIAVFALRRTSQPRRIGTAFVGVIAVGAVAAAGMLRGSPLQGALAPFTSLDPNWPALPEIVGSVALQFVYVRKFGLLFPLLAALLVAAHRQRRQHLAGPALLLLAAGLALIPLFLLGRHGVFLELTLTEGLPRYTMQFLGPAWIAAGLLADALFGADQQLGLGTRARTFCSSARRSIGFDA